MDQPSGAIVSALQQSGQDYEWYPTTRRMLAAVASDMAGRDERHESILDVGAGDGRALMRLAERQERAKLYAIEKATLLQQQQPDVIIPVGTEFWEQDLMGLPVDVLFSNPPYSEYEAWAQRIIESANAILVYLVLPQRWQDSEHIAAALKARGAKAEVIHEDDFLDAERRARARVHVIRITFRGEHSDEWSYRHYRRQDPFDLWFDRHIDTFDREEPLSDYEQERQALARVHALDSIPSMVAAFGEDYARMEENYRAIFRLDYQLLKELGVNKEGVRDGLKTKMAGLKAVYWKGLFEKLDVITSRLTTRTRRHFLDRLTGQTSVAFTEQNAYAVVLWAIRAANQYFDQQVVEVFRELSTHDGVSNYKSNQRTWEKDGWRYNAETHSHYALDYRVVLHHHCAIFAGEWGEYDYPGHLHRSAHEQIDDVIAVFGNLGFRVQDRGSRSRQWLSNVTQAFRDGTGSVLFEVKAFKNGNLHFRFDQRAIKALNIEAGRLLGWLRGPEDAVSEMGCTPEEAAELFGANRLLGASSVKLLGAAEGQAA